MRFCAMCASTHRAVLLCYNHSMDSSIAIIRTPISRAELQKYSLGGELVKAVVDTERSIVAVGGELHADEEQILLQDGSHQEHLWGINLYPDRAPDAWIEFDSMINVRPRQGNRSRGVESPALQKRIREVVTALVS